MSGVRLARRYLPDMKSRGRGQLLKRFERPEEIAMGVAFACSPLASGINGAARRADGSVVRSVV